MDTILLLYFVHSIWVLNHSYTHPFAVDKHIAVNFILLSCIRIQDHRCVWYGFMLKILCTRGAKVKGLIC